MYCRFPFEKNTEKKPLGGLDLFFQVRAINLKVSKTDLWL